MTPPTTDHIDCPHCPTQYETYDELVDHLSETGAFDQLVLAGELEGPQQ